MTIHVDHKPIAVCYVDTIGKKLRAFFGTDSIDNAMKIAKDHKSAFGTMIVLDVATSTIIATVK